MIEVLTSICGGKDNLQEEQPKGRYIAYVDGDTLPISNTWEIRKAYDKFKDPRRNSRIHKILIHKYSPDITIWMDGNMRLLVSPEEIVEKYLRDTDDMAVFVHGTRDCIYDEAMVCAQLGLDNVETIIEQAKYYEDRGYGKNKGLNSGGFIIRRNNHRTRRFNEVWFADYCRFSRRDQLSMMPAIDAVGLQVKRIDERWVIHPNGEATLGGVVAMTNHAHFEGNFNKVK